ncbi:MAG: O-antigen ligase family protein, partial [Ardenticatenaceae bacterium]
LYDEAGALVNYEGTRTYLREDVRPGETVALQAILRAPDTPGEYVVEWDMLQENVAWFSWEEAPPLRAALSVSGPPAEPTDVTAEAPPALLRIPTPDRATLWRAALRMVQARPLLGIGPGTFRLSYGAYLGMPLWDTNIHANNLYLEWLASTGILGLLFFLAVSWTIVRAAWRALTPGDTLWLWRVALMAALLAWYLHGLLDYFFEWTPTYVLFWLAAALAIRGVTGDNQAP